jgi:methylated-DNA-[protein]-cysteine S-methyltransferase
MPRLSLASPLGRLNLFETDGALTALMWGGKPSGKPTPLLTEAKRQLAAYFAGKRYVFDLPLAPEGSETEKRIWALMATIPYGETWTYGQLGRELGISPRQIGQACGRNPLPILLPCHRVVAANGELGGYSGEGGIETKRKLLQLEHALLI